ncbi:MAG: decarboxylating 6-phosphogluconate dehydrogenase [Candidatus Marinimicrobia bacterium]|nr:decarboxylating 6-phosphogluconate dehydrogenase [Candidatus Neomarinimicrobiota bacterium]
MKLGLIGLGKMGGNMTKRLLRDDHQVVVYDMDINNVKKAEGYGAHGATSPEDLVDQLAQKRVVWIMVPAGEAVDQVLDQITPHLDDEDIVVDGGNSNYQDTLRRGHDLKKSNIDYVDAGMSGGVWGLEEGYSMMIGGSDEAVQHLIPVIKTLAPGPPKGWGHVGKTGSGHFVKMVHNGIEYGMMQAYAEGFSVLKQKEDFELDLHQVADIWQYGSVIRSWLLELIGNALEDGQELENIAPYVEDSGEGRWTVFNAIDMDVPTPVITLALIERLRSRVTDSYTDKLLAAMRNQFGGHEVKESDHE